MGLHQQHAHRRVFQGEAAAQHLAAEKRDSHRNRIMDHVPASVAQKQADPSTVYSVVYVTASATFSGPTAGYVTIGGPYGSSTAVDQSAAASDAAASSSATGRAAGTPLQSTRGGEPSFYSGSDSSQVTDVSTATASPTPASSSSKWTFGGPVDGSTTLATTATTAGAGVVVGTPIGATRAGVVAGTPISATRSATPEIDETSSGMSGGAKAGLAIGIILAIALAAGLLFFCYRRRKNQNVGHEELLDEKRTSFFGNHDAANNNNRLSDASDRVAPSLRSTRTASTAPRLSLRPVTQFMGLGLAGDRKSSANQLDHASEAQMSEKASVWERRPANATEDPFRDGAAVNEKAVNPFDEPEADAPKPLSVKSGTSSHGQKSSWEGSEPPTPKSLSFGTAAAVPVTAVNGSAVPPVPRGPNNVHRVQLDFKPSMDDELELRSGQLVRMLHEYDDGWVGLQCAHRRLQSLTLL